MRRTLLATSAALISAVALAAPVHAHADTPLASTEGIVTQHARWGQSSQPFLVPDPYVVRGPSNYRPVHRMACWRYTDNRNALVAEMVLGDQNRYPPTPVLFEMPLPVDDTITVDWHNTTTGASGTARTTSHNTYAYFGIEAARLGQGIIEMDVHVRSQAPFAPAFGSLEPLTGNAPGVTEASTHVTYDTRGKSCA